MNGWFLSLIILHVLSLGFHLAKHGEDMKHSYNFWAKLFVSLVIITITYMAIKSGI